jgi:hypothetical protein
MRKLVGVVLVLLAALVTSGCSSGDDDDSSSASGGTACDPLAAGTTTVGSVLAAGVDASGTMYIVEEASGAENRIFVGTSGQLVRVPDVGSGGDGSGQSIFTFTSPGSTTSGDMELFVEVTGGTTTMALAPESDATSLTVIDGASVTGETAEDLPASVVFVADIGDATTLVITAPAEADGYSGYRLFLGAAPTLEQRTVTNYAAAVDGAATVTFDGPGGSETANIPCDTMFCSPGSPDGTLTGADGGTTSLTLREPTPTTLAGLSFLCQ